MYPFIWQCKCLIKESKAVTAFNQCIKAYLLSNKETNFSAKNMLKASLGHQKLKENTKNTGKMYN